MGLILEEDRTKKQKNNMQEAQEIELDLAMNNAYQIIIECATIDDLITSQPKKVIYLAFDPCKMEADDYWIDTITSMIEYFVLTEEYEKCAELKKLLS